MFKVNSNGSQLVYL